MAATLQRCQQRFNARVEAQQCDARLKLGGEFDTIAARSAPYLLIVSETAPVKPSWPDRWHALLERMSQIQHKYWYVTPIISLGLGISSYFMVERALGLARAFVVMLAAGWLLMMIEEQLHRLTHSATGFALPKSTVPFVTQNLHQEALFFCIPYFWAAASIPQMGVALLVTLAAIISVVDPIYYRLAGRFRAGVLAYHALAVFAIALIAAPYLLLLTADDTLIASLCAVGVLAIPAVWRGGGEGGRLPISLTAVAVAILAIAAAWFGRAYVPVPALRVADAVITPDVDRTARTHGEPVEALTLAEARRTGLYAFTAVRAPLGLADEVFHVWRHNGQEQLRLAFPLRGGREDGFRVWSRKQKFGDDALGRWTVTLETPKGQRVGQMQFVIE